MEFKVGDKVYWKREPHMSGFVMQIVPSLQGTVKYFVDIIFPLKRSILVSAKELAIYKEYVNNHIPNKN